MTIKRLNFESPYGCRWCGNDRRHHGRQWAPIIGIHQWIEPTQAAIKDRMWRRLDARLNAESTVYHATTGWAPDHTGESAEPYCADCKTDGCPRWARIQTRLDQQRFGLPRRTRRSRKTSAGSGGWGDEVAVLSAFALWPLAVLELGPRAIAHLARTLTRKETTRP